MTGVQTCALPICKTEKQHAQENQSFGHNFFSYPLLASCFKPLPSLVRVSTKQPFFLAAWPSEAQRPSGLEFTQRFAGLLSLAEVTYKVIRFPLFPRSTNFFVTPFTKSYKPIWLKTSQRVRRTPLEKHVACSL